MLAPRGAYIWRGDLTEGFLPYEFGGLYLEGLIHGGAYFRNFTLLSSSFCVDHHHHRRLQVKGLYMLCFDAVLLCSYPSLF